MSEPSGRATAHSTGARLLRRARRNAVPGRGDRRDHALPARGQCEYRRAVRDERPHGRADRARPRRRRPLPLVPSRRGRLWAEHDLAQLPAHARARPAARARRRDRLHAARPRRERGTVAGARARTRRRRPLRRCARRPLARPRRPGGAALRAHAGRRVPDRVERGRDDARRRAGRRTRARRRRARLGRRRPLRAARTASTSPAGTSTSSSARPTSSSARTWGWRSASASFSRACGRTRCAPSDNDPVGNRFQHGTQQHELLAGFVAAVEYVESLGLGRDRRARDDAGAALPRRRPEAVELYGLRTMEGRVPDVRVQPRRPFVRGGRDGAGGAARSRSGTATTTRSRS